MGGVYFISMFNNNNYFVTRENLFPTFSFITKLYNWTQRGIEEFTQGGEFVCGGWGPMATRPLTEYFCKM